MNNLSPRPSDVEEDRIRSMYAKRQKDDVRYSWFSPGHLFIVQEREWRLLTLLRRHNFAPLDTKRILEIGCGTGYWLREFIKWGARPENIIGIDLLPDRVVEARKLSPKAVKIYCGSATQLTFPDATFDLVLQSTVFSSVLAADTKQQIASEMLRVLKGNGLI